MVDVKSKEVKRACLNELSEYITSEKGVLTERCYPEIIQMVCKSHCQSVVLSRVDLAPCWPHCSCHFGGDYCFFLCVYVVVAVFVHERVCFVWSATQNQYETQEM